MRGVVALLVLLLPTTAYASVPQSATYRLDAYGFTAGGGGGSSANYEAEIVIGAPDTGLPSSTSYLGWLGLTGRRQANVPPAPTFTNPSSFSDRLLVQLNVGANPSDATFAVALSTDGFATWQWVKSDNTLGASLTAGDYRTYTGWGSGTGTYVLNLAHTTTYQARVLASRGYATESRLGPSASAATVVPALTFDIDIAATDTETSEPYSVALGNLAPASVTTASNRIWFDIATNGVNGATVWVRAAVPSLVGDGSGATIPSVTGNLTSLSEGWGLQVASLTQTTGSLSASSPFNGSAENVGILTTTFQPVATAAGQLVGGRGSIFVKAKPLSDQAADSYQSQLTLVASASF